MLLPLRVLWILWLCQESVISIICSNKSRYGRSSYVYEKATWNEKWNYLQCRNREQLEVGLRSILLAIGVGVHYLTIWMQNKAMEFSSVLGFTASILLNGKKLQTVNASKYVWNVYYGVNNIIAVEKGPTTESKENEWVSIGDGTYLISGFHLVPRYTLCLAPETHPVITK